MKIYMFHYVTENFNYYHFDKNKFEEVVKNLSLTNKIINLKELKKLYQENEKIPDSYVMLTFDDGTIDHYKYVYPILKKYNVPGVFFVCSNIVNKKNLNIQLIHQILSKCRIDDIYIELQNFIFENNIEFKDNCIVDKSSYAWKEIYVKKMIQTILPEEYSNKILNKLINKYNIPSDFEKLYMSIENMLEMKANNMDFGCHTKSHKRLSYLIKDEQIDEIKENMQILFDNKIIDKHDVLSLAYPFGDYNIKTIEILKSLNYDFAFTTKEENVYKISKYELPRIDCNVLKL